MFTIFLQKIVKQALHKRKINRYLCTRFRREGGAH